MGVVADVTRKLESLRGTLLPSDGSECDPQLRGVGGGEKYNELLMHMGIAVVSVAILIWLALGKRESGS